MAVAVYGRGQNRQAPQPPRGHIHEEMMICLPCGPSGTGGDIIPLFTEKLCGHLLFCNFAMILLSSSAETLRRVLYAVNILGIMSTKSDAEIEIRRIIGYLIFGEL